MEKLLSNGMGIVTGKYLLIISKGRYHECLFTDTLAEVRAVLGESPDLDEYMIYQGCKDGRIVEVDLSGKKVSLIMGCGVK